MKNYTDLFPVNINFPIRIADTFSKRFIGFMGRKKAEYGLLFVPCKSIHTFFMKMDIDVVYLDRSFTIIEVVPAVKPWKVSFHKDAYCILELPAGAAFKHGIAAGNHL